MKRKITSVMLVGACFFGGARAAPAKEKPILERIEARVSPSSVSTGSSLDVTIEIYEYSSDQELQDLAQIFVRRGKEGLESALGKIRKGYLTIPGPGRMPVELVDSRSVGGIRRVTIVAERGQRDLTTRSMQVDVLVQEYPFTCVQLEFDEQGNGKGEIVQYAKLGFNSAGKMTINRYNTRPAELINVHSWR